MEILATVCARAGSKGVKSKNMRDYLGVPICYYTLSGYALFLERFGKDYGGFTLAVNTDAIELYEQMDKTSVPYIKVPRKAELATDTASKIDVIRDTLRCAEAETGKKFDVVMDMDLTSPLRRVEDIKNIIDALLNSDGAEVALSVTEARRNPYFNQLIRGENGYLRTAIISDFVARQQAPEVFDANASLYAYRPAFLLGTNTIINKAKLVPSVMPDTAVLDIDSERDFELISLLGDYFFKNDEAYGEIKDNIKNILV